jgi:cyclopropane-fatty-acyl-phospholipid synthase
LDEAEEFALQIYSDRAQLHDGQQILELGCGWGSFTLWMAERYPNAKITGVSNSATQRQHILAEAQKRGLNNVEILTCDVNVLELKANTFDRVVSVEMFEHVRNYQKLLRKFSLGSKQMGCCGVIFFVIVSYIIHLKLKVNMIGCHATFYRWFDAINVNIFTFSRAFRTI